MVEKTSLTLKNGVLLALLIGLLSVASDVLAQLKDLDKSFSTVVMIEGKHQGTTSFGAGIVIGSRAGRIYIVTANHVVRSGHTDATDIKVQFRFLPGEKLAAKLLSFKNSNLDLAVMSVTAPNSEIPRSEFNFKVLGDSNQLKRSSDVHPLGYPQAKPWGVALNPEKVDFVKVSEIAFQSSFIQKGHSGGALLDSCGDIVGLIVRDNPPTGEAVRIEAVVQELVRWNYPVSMEKTGGCTPKLEENRPDPPSPDPVAETPRECLFSGLVFDSETTKPLSSVWMDLQEDKGKRSKKLKALAATTGPQGEFIINCNEFDESQFPLRIALRHRDWNSTLVTGTSIEGSGKWEGINISVKPQLVKKPLPPKTPPRQCKLYSWWNEKRGDNFLTSNSTWSGSIGKERDGYRLFRIEGKVFCPNQPQPNGTIPLVSLWNPKRGDNFASTNPKLANGPIGEQLSNGYRRYRLEGFIYSSKQPGTVPLVSLWNPKRGDNFASTNPKLADGPIGEELSNGYKRYRLEGFIFR